MKKLCKNRQNSGITLIALVITIIIMLILVAVTITITLGENGILGKIQEAKKEQEVKEDYETLQDHVAGTFSEKTMEVDFTELDKKLGNIGWTGEDGTYTSPNGNIFTVSSVGTITSLSDSTSGNKSVSGNQGRNTPPTTYLTLIGLGDGVTSLKYSDLKGDIKTAAANGKIIAVLKEGDKLALIPNGFTVSTATGENTISKGLVIYEGTEEVNDNNVTIAKTTRNQFVWVPVQNVIKDQNTPISATYKPMIKLKNDCSSSYESVLYDFSGTTSEEDPIVDTGFLYEREPVLVTKYDNQSSHRISKELMDASFNNMASSVVKYGGFYVGRYETTNLNSNKITVMQGLQKDINNQSWYTIYENSKTLSTKCIQSEMIWGCQWDAMLNWMLTGIQASKVTAKTNVIHNGNSGDDPLPAGSRNDDIINNIYDLESNVKEFSQEANNLYFRCRISCCSRGKL